MAPPYLFSRSAYQVTGDSTELLALSAPVLIIRMIVVVDSAWIASDSLKIGTTGTSSLRPGDWWGTDSTSRGTDTTYKRIYLNAAEWTGALRSLFLYHPDLEEAGDARRIGKIDVYIWWQDFPGSDEFTVFRTE
jgi:hypothetical protein